MGEVHPLLDTVLGKEAPIAVVGRGKTLKIFIDQLRGLDSCDGWQWLLTTTYDKTTGGNGQWASINMLTQGRAAWASFGTLPQCKGHWALGLLPYLSRAAGNGYLSIHHRSVGGSGQWVSFYTPPQCRG